MLGSFALTSSFSRRSSRGYPMGLSRFVLCFCESGPLNVFTISCPIHRSFANQSCRLGCSLAHPGDVPRYSYGSVLAQSDARGGPEIFRTRSAAEAKMWHASESG